MMATKEGLSQIDQLRREGRTIEAFQRTLELICATAYSSDLQHVWLSQFESDSCLLLEMARAARTAGQRPRNLRALMDPQSEVRQRLVGSLPPETIALVDARLAAIEAWHARDAKKLAEAVGRYQRVWTVRPTQFDCVLSCCSLGDLTPWRLSTYVKAPFVCGAMREGEFAGRSTAGQVSGIGAFHE